MNNQLENSQKFDDAVISLKRELLVSDCLDVKTDNHIDGVESELVAKIVAKTCELPQRPPQRLPKQKSGLKNGSSAVQKSVQSSVRDSVSARCRVWLISFFVREKKSDTGKLFNTKFSMPFVAMVIAAAVVISFFPINTPEQALSPVKLATAIDVDLTFEELWLAEDEWLFLDAS